MKSQVKPEGNLRETFGRLKRNLRETLRSEGNVRETYGQPKGNLRATKGNLRGT